MSKYNPTEAEVVKGKGGNLAGVVEVLLLGLTGAYSEKDLEAAIISK